MGLVVLLVLVVIAPLLGIWDFRRLARWTAEGRADARSKTYRFIIFMEWGLALGLPAWRLAAGRDLASLGLVAVAGGWRWLAIGLGLAGAIYLVHQMRAVSARSRAAERTPREG